MNRRGKSASGGDPSDERGTALIVALLVMVIMTLLGIPFLLMGETENRIAENERLSLQALYAAESGARVVKRWFDRPGYADNVINPPLAAIDREQRDIDADGDPATAAVDADGSPELPYYKQDDDAVFSKPFRGSLIDTLLGTEDGPDMCIDAADSADAEAFLRDLSSDLFGGYPSGNAGRRARISHIDVYAPPYVQVGGTWKRYGVGTVKVVAGIYQEYPDDSEILLAQRTVKIVLSEGLDLAMPTMDALNVCGPMDWNQKLTVHWGTIRVAVPSDNPAYEPDLASPITELHKLTVGLPRVLPASTEVDLLWGVDDNEAWNAYYRDILELGYYEIQDPWMRFVSSTAIKDAPDGADQQPWPFSWIPGDDLESGDIPYRPHSESNPPPVQPDWEGTHSNYIQKLDEIGVSVDCPELDYTEWKQLALGGGENVHYYEWAGGDQFKENGEGIARSFRDITDGQTGLFFFDTTDGNPPDGSNLTPPIVISETSGETWGVRGMVYLNAQVFHAHGVTGRATIFRAPGEPFQDKNRNGVWNWDEADPLNPNNELWVNLEYPDELDGEGGRFHALNEIPEGTAVRDPRGPPIVGDALVQGVLYTNGVFDSRASGNYYGAVVAVGGIIEGSLAGDSPDIYWDAGLFSGWPPNDWGLGTVVISRWETDR